MKAQVSVEGMATMGIVLAIFAILVFATLSAQGTSQRLNAFLEKREECIRVSNDLYSAFVLGNGAKVGIKISELVDIVNNTIYVKKSLSDSPVICSSRAPVADSSLSIGSAQLENLNGVIVISNV